MVIFIGDSDFDIFSLDYGMTSDDNRMKPLHNQYWSEDVTYSSDCNYSGYSNDN